MAAFKDGNEAAQLNCIYRMKHWSETHKYRPVQTKVISDQFDISCPALKEETKFLQLIYEGDWPNSMSTVIHNRLRITLYNAEIEGSAGNDTGVLESLWKSFKRIYPAKGRSIEELVQRSQNSDDTDEMPALPSDRNTQKDSSSLAP